MKETMTIIAEYDTDMDSLAITVDCWEDATRLDVMMRLLAIVDTTVETITDSKFEFDKMCEMLGYLVINLPELSDELKNYGQTAAYAHLVREEPQ